MFYFRIYTEFSEFWNFGGYIQVLTIFPILIIFF